VKLRVVAAAPNQAPIRDPASRERPQRQSVSGPICRSPSALRAHADPPLSVAAKGGPDQHSNEKTKCSTHRGPLAAAINRPVAFSNARHRAQGRSRTRCKASQTPVFDPPGSKPFRRPQSPMARSTTPAPDRATIRMMVNRVHEMNASPDKGVLRAIFGVVTAFELFREHRAQKAMLNAPSAKKCGRTCWRRERRTKKRLAAGPEPEE